METIMEKVTINQAKANAKRILESIDKKLVDKVKLIKCNYYELLESLDSLETSITVDEKVIVGLYNGCKRDQTAEGQVVTSYKVDPIIDILTELYNAIPENERIATNKTVTVKVDDRTARIKAAKLAGVNAETMRMIWPDCADVIEAVFAETTEPVETTTETSWS
jgi:hypothetical protein